MTTTETTITRTGRYFIGGRVLSDTQNKFSCLAYQGTAGLVEGKPRISAKELKALLADLGIDPSSSEEWDATLANGTRIGFRAGDVSATSRVRSATVATGTRSAAEKRSANASAADRKLADLATMGVESAALREWRQAGSDPKTRPATPLHDAREAANATRLARKAVAPQTKHTPAVKATNTRKRAPRKAAAAK